jgi:hypothetical protein
MFFNKVYLYILLVVIAIGTTFFLYSSLKNEYRLTNSHGGARTTINLLSLESTYLVDSLAVKFTANDLKGLPIVDLYLSDKSKSSLSSNIPKNIKNWVPGYFRYPSGDYKEVKARYRGDNLFNWSYERKSYRVKLKKKNLINTKRVLNYTPLSKTDALTRYMPYILGKKLNLPAPDVRLVEFRLNGINHGIYLEYASIDEGFLRRNNFMPVNIYKGEQFHTGRDQFKGVELFNNPALWEKSAIFNQRDENNYDDLGTLISLIAASKDSDETLSKFTNIANIESWAKFDAFQTLLQSWHNDDEHNMRLISDVWRGQMLPIVYEVVLNVYPNQTLSFENPPHSLLKNLNQNSEFLYAKYKALFSMLNTKILSSASSHILDLEDLFNNSNSRDIFRGKSSNLLENKSLDSFISWKKYANFLVERERNLLNVLIQPPESSWWHDNNTLSISIDGIVPLHKPAFKLKSHSSSVNHKIYFDKDGDGRISNHDILIPTFFEQGWLIIDATFFANRVSFKNFYNDYPKTVTTDTVFRLISNSEFEIIEGASTQFFDRSKVLLEKSNIYGKSPNLLNKPVFEEAPIEEVWSGSKFFQNTNIFQNKIKILPGTSIFLSEGASLIFKNQVIAEGQKDSQINFISNKSDSIWGAIGLVGPSTKNSVFKYVNMSGGSGFDQPNLRMVGMFSLHDTSNVYLSNMNFTNNHIYDDLIHIVYSKNITLINSTVKKSLFDAIDIDISEVIIDNCLIESSGNDGIDSMSSFVKIENTEIIGSIDKGVSIGEKSNVLIIDSNIINNNIGIESKDQSIANVYESTILTNSLDINAYKKNWQYGGGGIVNLINYEKSSQTQNIKKDKHSDINFVNYDNDKVFKSLRINLSKMWDESISNSSILSDL